MLKYLIGYAITYLTFTRITLLAGLIPAIPLSILNRFEKKFTPQHPLSIALGFLPSILVLFLYDRLWLIVYKVHIPFVLILVLILYYLYARAHPASNYWNRREALLSIMGCSIYAIIMLFWFGFNRVNWF